MYMLILLVFVVLQAIRILQLITYINQNERLIKELIKYNDRANKQIFDMAQDIAMLKTKLKER